MRQVLTILTVITVLSGSLFAQNPISFDEYQKRLQNSLPEWQESEQDLKRAKIALDQALSYLNPRINATVNGSSGSGSSSGTLSIDRQSGVVANLGIQQTLPFGIRIKADLDYSHITLHGTNLSMNGLNMSTGSFNYATNEYDQTTDTPKITFQATLPLLMNFGGILDSYAAKDAALKKDLTALNVTLTRRNLSAAYAKSYYQWIYQNRMLDYLKESLKNSLLQEEQIKQKVKDGLADPDHYEAVRIQRFSVVEQIRQTENGIENLNILLSSVLNLSNETPATEAWQTALSEDINDTHFVPFEETESYKVMALNLKRMKLSLGLLENKALPNLNLIGQLAVNSDSTTNGAGEAFAYLNQPEGYVGLQFSYPIGNTDANGKINDTRLAIEQLKLQIAKQKRDYNHNLQNLKEKISYYHDMIKIKDQMLKRIQTKYKEEQTKYNQGRLSLSDLIATQSSLISAQIALTGYEYNLISSELDYHTLIGK